MLRQWLNEERIKDGKYFVTNEDIEHWLHLYEVALNNVFNKQPSIDDLKEAIWQKLRTDPRADTYVIPERVMDCIVDEAKAQIEQLLQSARIEENRKYLDRINNYTPDPNAPSFGSASGAMETQGWKNAFEDRIAELEAYLTNKEDK